MRILWCGVKHMTAFEMLPKGEYVVPAQMAHVQWDGTKSILCIFLGKVGKDGGLEDVRTISVKEAKEKFHIDFSLSGWDLYTLGATVGIGEPDYSLPSAKDPVGEIIHIFPMAGEYLPKGDKVHHSLDELEGKVIPIMNDAGTAPIKIGQVSAAILFDDEHSIRVTFTDGTSGIIDYADHYCREA